MYTHLYLRYNQSDEIFEISLNPLRIHLGNPLGFNSSLIDSPYFPLICLSRY